MWASKPLEVCLSQTPTATMERPACRFDRVEGGTCRFRMSGMIARRRTATHERRRDVSGVGDGRNEAG